MNTIQLLLMGLVLLLMSSCSVTVDSAIIQCSYGLDDSYIYMEVEDGKFTEITENGEDVAQSIFDEYQTNLSASTDQKQYLLNVKEVLQYGTPGLTCSSYGLS